MVETTTSEGGTGAQALIRFWADSVLSESPEKVDAETATDAETVIESQLVENTGRHILDSGGAYGRNFEENRETPPWEKPTYNVHGDGTDGFVTKNVYDHMSETLERDRDCVALETALFEFGRSDDRKRDAWLTTMKEFPEWVGQGYAVDFEEFGFDVETAQLLAAVEHDDHHSWNTYNHEFGSLSQTLQGVTVNSFAREVGPKYSLIQVHGGGDVRGGYTAPRVYKHDYAQIPHPMEGSIRCENCGWTEAESCLHGKDLVVYDRDENETRCNECGNEIHMMI